MTPGDAGSPRPRRGDEATRQLASKILLIGRLGGHGDQMKLRACAAVTATMIATLGFLPTNAQAKSSSVVPVLGHPAATKLSLLGASTAGVVVRQEGALGYGFDAKFYSGAEGGQLAERLELASSPSQSTSPQVLAVNGTTLAWQHEIPGAGVHLWQVHRMDVRTGKDVNDGKMPQANGFTKAGWLSTAISSFSSWPPPQPTLKRYQPDPDSELLAPTPIAGVDQFVGTAANDESAMLLATREFTDLSQNDGEPRYNLDLLDLNAKTSTRLVNRSEQTVVALALSPHTLSWVTRLDEGDGVQPHYTGPAVVHIKPRSGHGPVLTYTESASPEDATQIAATDAGVGYVVDADGNTRLRVVKADGSAATSVDLPDGSSGVAAVGSRFLTAVGGTDAVAGVYSVNGTEVTRTATVPSATYPIASMALSAGVLHYTDGSEPGDAHTLWRRSVSGKNRPVLGPSSAVAEVPVESSFSYPGPPLAFSAGRGLIRRPSDGQGHLIDRGRETGTIPTPHGKVSGPYTLSAGKVYRPDGELVWSEPATDEGTSATDDIFGATLVYARQPEHGDATIWVVRNLENPQPQQLGTIYRTDESCRDAPQVAVWGESVVWGSGCGGDGLQVRNLRTGGFRTLYSLTGLSGFTLGEGVLAWQTVAGTNVLNLRGPDDGAPVVLPGPSMRLMLDDHRIARQKWARGKTTYDIQPLPFDEKYAPRLIAPYATGGFTQGRSWSPQFDVTKPLKGVKLIIADSTGTTVRKLEGTAADGSIRDLSWDGRNTKGVQVPVGVYRWELTGRADDGDGLLTDAWGRAKVQGTVEITPAQTVTRP